MRFEDALREGRHRLSQAGIEGAAYEARLLLAHAAQCLPADLIGQATQCVPRSVLSVFQALLTQRETRQPIQHILGETDFYGLTLKSDRRALIPRPDSECVVELALSHISTGARNVRIADLGTGSGCLLLAVLAQRPNARGLGLDQSAEAIALARENAALTGIAGRVDMSVQSWLSWKDWGDYDLVISNPPYIQSDIIQTLAPEVRDFDPRIALDGGRDGLSAYRELIDLASQYMSRGSHLVLEIGYDQCEAVSDLLMQAGFTDLECSRDLAGQDRAISVRKD